MNDRAKTFSLALVVVIGMLATVAVARVVDARRPPADVTATANESLYLNSKTAKRLSLGFNGLAADWYWMRSLQYVGRKIMAVDENTAIDDLSQLDLKLLAPLLDNATALDPEFLDPYEYAAVVLPAIDVKEAIRITSKGLDANPTAWRLYQHLGYIYWQQGDYAKAAEVYARGAQLPGAPIWLEAMKARMAAEGGSRTMAREIYARMFEQSSDAKVKDMARRRLLQLKSLDERDGLRKLLAMYQTRAGHCPENWREIETALRAVRAPLDASGAPLDPSGAPYVLDPAKCEVGLDQKSEILTK
jgi:tetratricopeptide (TPR) repeat protein